MQNALHAENMRLNPLTLSSAGSPHAFVRSRQHKADSWWVPFALGTFRAHCRQPLLNRITSELPVIRPQAAESLQIRSEEHTSELQSRLHLVCRLLLEKKKQNAIHISSDARYMDLC